MEKINLPDGRTLNLPSDLPIETRNTIAKELQRDFGIDINRAGVFERVLDAPKSVLRGAASLLTDVPLGISALTLGVDDERTQALQGLQRYLRTDSILASDPNLRDKFTTKLAEGAGSFVPFLGAGMLGARLAKEGVVKPVTGAFGIPAALAVPTGIAAQADRIDSARAMGEEVGPVAEKLALLGGGAIGTTEILPIAAIFRRIPRNVLKYPDVRDKLKSAALTGTFEGGQEVFASVAQDLVARGLYSDELPIGESLFEEFTIGGIIGAGADLLVNSMNRRSVTLEHLKSREEAARKKLYSVYNDEKFTKAQEQGELTVFQEKPIVKIPDIKVPENLGPNPDLAVIQNPDTSYSVVDINNPDNPVLQSFKPEEENKALAFKNKTESNFLRKKLATEVAFANFFQGLQESGQAKQLGFTILDPNNTEINLQTLLDFDKSLSEEQRLALKKEKDQAYGPRTYNEIFQNRKERLPLVSDYLTKKGLPLSASFTITEAKNALPNRQFNELMRSLGNVVFQANEGAGFDSLRTGEKVDTTLKAYRELAKSKNIELDFNDPAVQFATEQWTGIKDIRKTQNKGVRELFLARLQSLKPFNNVTPFPDYRPRPYTVEDMNAFVEGARDGNFVFNANDLKVLNPSFFQNRPEVAEQFFNDLVKSGRVGPSERKGKFKVNPNYEFDIARRAGGFFETPEQFRARLQAEGKLPQEIIDNLYNQELINQEGLIPPKPFEEQIINFREAVEQGRVNKFAQETKKLLDKVGLKETGVIVSDELLSTTSLRRTDAQGNIIFDPSVARKNQAEAEYDKNTDIIFISLNAINPDGVLSDVEVSARIKSLVEHELIHALRTKDLITEPEYQFLRKEVKRRKVPQAVSKIAFDAGDTFYTRAVKGYTKLAQEYSLSPEASEELFVEEAIAELFRHRDVTPTAPKKVDGIFNKIVQFFTELGTAFRSSGYQRASELFADIEQGRVGSRERGQIRTLLALDKRPPEDAGLPTVEDDEPITPNDVSVTYDAKEIAEGAPEDTTVIGTPVPVESDTKPITGVVVKPPSRVLRGLYDVRDKTIEELQADRLEFINGIGGARQRKNSLDVLDWLIKNGPRGDYKLLAERFRDQMVKIKKVADVDFGFTVIQKGTDRLPPQRGRRISNYLGVSHGPFDYNGRKTMQIYINDIGNVGKPGVHGVDYNTILHELVHQVTQANVHLGQYLRGDEKTNKNYIALENLRKRVAQELKKLPQSERDFYVNYGTKNVHEFLAVGFTDRVMQKFMEDIKTDKKSKKSLWDQFTTIIRRILGIPAKAGTVFSEFLKQGGKITNLSTAQIRRAFEDSFVAGTIVNATPRTRTSEADAVIGRPAEPEVTDVPSFSVPENTKESLQQYIDFTEDQIFRLEKESVQEGGLMTPGSYKRLQGRIRQAKRNLSFYQEKLSELNKLEERDPEQLPLFSRADTIPKDSDVQNLKVKVDSTDLYNINQQLDKSRLGISPSLEEAAKLNPAITDIFKKNKILAAASNKFLKKFTNKNGNLVLFRAIALKEGDVIKNYGQLPQDDYASTSLNSRAAIKIGRQITSSIFGPRKQTQILRYEVPMNRVQGYVPMLLKAIEESYMDNVKDGLYSSTMLTEAEIKERQEEGYYDDGEYFERPPEGSIEEALVEEQEKFEDILAEAEVLADLRGIKPSYQYAPGNFQVEPTITRDVPLFALREGVRNSAPVNSARAKKLERSVAEIEEQVRQMPNGEIPPYNLRASDVALDAALDYNRDQSPPELPDDIPNFSLGTIPDELKDAATQVDNNYQGPTQSFGRRMIELFRDPTDGTKRDGVKEPISTFFSSLRTQLIDKYNDIEKALVKGGKINDEVRDKLNNAATSAIAAIRMADRSRGVFQGLLNVGYVVDQIDGESSLPKVLPLEIQARYNKFVEPEKEDVRDMSGAIIKEAGKSYGGLTKILMPLYSDPQVDKERIFKIYAALKRLTKLEENGREVKTPIDVQKAPESIEYIEQNFKEVVEAYNNYQVWNNRLIDFAKRKGLLSEAQAALWIKHSSYYPFYKTMIDDTTQGPRIAAGVLPNNPLQIKLEGSENPLNINPVEAISRNSLAILTGSLKNDGVSKLIEQLNIIDPDDAIEATTPAERKSQNTIPYFVDGQKKFAILKDPAMFHAIQGIGGISTDIVSKVVGFPARILRDTVTRDPGFIMVNLLRDTLSATVTSGVPLSLGGEGFTPIKDTFYNMTQDMNELEAFGVLGGYDFQNDEGSVKQFVDRAMRKQGLNPDNSMKVEDLFYKVWDGLGALTTKSDGATRLAVYHAVYKDQKANGASEAQAQSEAAFQALEIINFGRRGLSPVFRIVTSAIPFLNARVQGLDVLWRSASGQYSSIKKLQPGQSPEQLKKDIMLGFLKRGGMLAALTGIYYLLVSDTDEYKNLRREVRDDNWVIPLGGGYAAKIPIPFEVGMMFKAFPERLFDLAMGEDALSKKALDEAIISMKRQLGTSANLPFFDAGFGIQLLKPIAEVYQNRNTFTNTDIIPYYQTKLEPALQQRASTNEVARQLGETFNISPIKIEHIVRGYTGTLGGYILDVIDAVARGVTGTPITPPNISQIPVINRLLVNADRSGGIQQQYYELRNDVDRAVQTLNKLRKEGRMNEYSAYRSGNQGVLNVKAQVRAIDRYLENWRRRRDSLLRNEDMSAFVKTDLLEELEAERDRRLAIVPELRKKANVPLTQIGNF